MINDIFKFSIQIFPCYPVFNFQLVRQVEFMIMKQFFASFKDTQQNSNNDVILKIRF